MLYTTPQAQTPATLTEVDIRAAHPHTSFPQPLTPADVVGLGYWPVQPTPQPVHDPLTHVCTEVAPVRIDSPDAGEQWQQAWQVTPRPAAEAAQLQAAHAAQQASAARQQRTALLQATDWTQLPDVQAGMPPEQRAAYAVYRQALRDWPSHPSFPDPASLPTI